MFKRLTGAVLLALMPGQHALADELLDALQRAAPVSYTHLDVYKRQRPHGSPLLAALEARVLDRVLAQPELPTPPDPVSPLPTQLRWAL